MTKRLFKKCQLQGAIKIQDRRVVFPTQGFEFIAATKQMVLFQQSAGVGEL